MRRLLVGVLLFAFVAPASAGDSLTRRAVKYAVREHLAVTLETPGERARARVFNCRKWRCEFTVRGTAQCHGVAHVRPDGDTVWIWFDPLRCR